MCNIFYVLRKESISQKDLPVPSMVPAPWVGISVTMSYYLRAVLAGQQKKRRFDLNISGIEDGDPLERWDSEN